MANHDMASRVRLLKQGKALPGKDGGPPRFPIEDGGDLDSAIKLAGTDEERKHVYQQARNLGQLGKVPANWNPDGSTSN